MKKKLLHDISASSLQVIINQCCGFIIFYILSAQLTKNDFGEINWTLAVLLTSFGILSFGIDQVAIKKIAEGKDIESTLSVYVTHVLFSGILIYALLLAGTFFFSQFYQAHQLLLFIGMGKLMVFFSTPFKQLATGLEKFKALLWMSVCSNLLRSAALLVFAFTKQLTLNSIIIIFIIGDAAELLVSLLITRYRLKIPVLLQWNAQHYSQLVKESLPQLGVAIFTSAIARIDWIFLGLLASNVVLANYSFAYKLFEVATLPLLIIAPILIPRFTKLFKDANPAAINQQQLFIILRMEIIIASLAALVLNILWVPVIDVISNNRYGAVNTVNIFILSASMPFIYFNNFLWTINFVKGRLKQIFYIFLICFAVNLIATILLIPFYGAEGAAAAYLLSVMVQSLLFFRQPDKAWSASQVFSLLLPPCIAIAAGLLVSYLFAATWLILLLAFIIYTTALILTKQLRRSHWFLLRQISGW
jgi:O-antigen/teichoic acid export membrane protein